MKKRNYSFALWCGIIALFTTACSENDSPIPPTQPEVTTLGAYVLNAGNWGANNGTIQWFDLGAESIGSDLFKAANGSDIGDPQDLCVYGSKRYIACTTSAKIEVVNGVGKRVTNPILLTNDLGQPVKPRYITAAEGYVYFTAQDGSLSKIDTTSLTVVDKLELGGYPEALTYANGKLYVNQSDYTSDGSGKSVSVVTLSSFEKTKEIEIKLNPYTQIATGEDGNVYVVSNGNYAGTSSIPEENWIYQTVQCINTTTDNVTDLCKGTYIALAGSKMVVLYAEYYLPDTHRIFVRDLVTGKEENLPIELSQFKNPSFLSIHPTTGDIYIGDAPYSSKGDIYIFTESGSFKKKIEAGISPLGLYFVTQ